MAHTWVPTDTFGTRLLLARRELDLTVKEAAAMCGLHYATWSTWENGRKPADMAAVVKAVSDGLGVSRAWLMWGRDAENPHPGPDGGSHGVRREGIEPPTRWFRGNDLVKAGNDLAKAGNDLAKAA